MPSPYSERMPNGMDAINALLPDRWRKLLARGKGLETDGPAIADRIIKPEWASNSNPVELNAPQVTTGSLVSGRDPGEMVVARGAAPQEPIRPMPVLRPDLERLGIPSDAIEVPKTPQYEGGRYVGSNVDYAPPEVRGNIPAETIAPQTVNVPQPAFNPSTTLQPGVPSERPRSFDKLDPLSKIAMRMRPDRNMPIADAGPSVDVAQPSNLPVISGRGYFGQGVPSPEDEETIRPKVVDPTGRLIKQIQFERDNPAIAKPNRGFWGKALDDVKMGLVGAGQAIAADPNHSLVSGLGGFGAGAILQGVRPATLPQFKQQGRVRGYENQLGKMQAIQGRQIKQQGELADIGLKRSQTYRNLHPLPQTELVKVKGQGAFLVNKQTGSKMKVDLPEEVNPEEWEQTEANGLLYWRNKRTQETKPMTYNGTQLQNDADVPVDVTPDGGPTLRTRQGQAASALIEAGSRGATISNQQSAADREAVVKQIDDNYTQDATRRTQARQEVNDLQGLIRQAEAEQAEVGSPVGDTDEKKQAYAAFHAQKYKALWDAVQNKAQQIRGAYGDVIDESDQSLPEPGGGSIAEGVVRGATGGNRKYPTGVKPQGAKQAYPPPVTYRSAPVPKVSVRGGAQSSGTQFSGQRMSRANLPAVAKRWGVSPEQAESTFTQGGGVIY